MLDKEISELIAYAQTHLMLDALDSAKAARGITRLLKIDSYTPLGADDVDVEAIENMTDPDALLDPVLEYAESKGINTPALKSEIMDALCLKPSEINDLFADTYAVNPQKAFDFLYDYCVKDGYVDLRECAKNDRWEAKELKSRIEIIINLMPQAKTDGYPVCPLCKEYEGYGDRANMRSVTTDIDGEEWFFNYSRHQYFDKHGVLVNKTHTPLTDGKETLKKLALAADFIGSDGFVGMNAVVENGGALNTAHEHFQTGFRSTPMLKAGYKYRLKSKEYPYLEMGVVDWYCTVIRFAHSNLEKTVEFADKLITAWKAYSDDRIANDGKKNFCNVVVRKVAGKYCFDVALRSNALKKPRMSAEFEEIKSGALALNDVMGYFVLPTKLSEQLKQVQLYLDGTVPFDPQNTTAQTKAFSKMIERMLAEQGGTVTKLEAKLNLHDEIDIACEKILKSSAVFDESNIENFLDTLEINKL